MSQQDPPSAPDQQVLGGRYEIHRRLARGGMAEVYLARDRALDRPVAVKVLFPEFSTDPAFVERFRREAQAAANLAQPNIVGVYDWGAENGTYYIVMEYVDGQSLAEVMRSTGPLHPRRAAEIAFEVAGALGAAHQRGVVHRDIKPGNVLISSAGVAKVTDFGIARALSSPSDDLTQAGSVMGTATYFSPEQAQGFSVDARSDLYSLGVVLFEIVTGRPPFTGETPVSIAYKHVQERTPRPSDIVSGMPVGLEAIIMKLLAKKPDDRYLSAEDLRADLRRWLDGHVTEAEREAAAGAAVATPPPADRTMAMAAVGGADATRINAAATGAVPVAEQWADDEPAPSRTGLFFGILVVLLAVLGVLGFFIYRNLTKSDGSSTDTASVPSVVNLSKDDATKQLQAAGFVVDAQTNTSTVAKGLVYDQSPKANVSYGKGKTVVIFVSSGPAQAKIPPVAGLSYDAALKKLTDPAVGFTDVQRQDVDSATVAQGYVVGTDPAEGSTEDLGAQITIQVSKGQATTPIPDVATKSVAAAQQALLAAGFKVGPQTTAPSDTVAVGKVVGTTPDGAAAPGSTVSLIVSSGPSQVTVPSVKGKTESDAEAALSAKGLQYDLSFTTLAAGDPNIGRVISSSPVAGAQVAPNSTVSLTVGAASSSGGSTSTTTAGSGSTTTTTKA